MIKYINIFFLTLPSSIWYIFLLYLSLLFLGLFIIFVSLFHSLCFKNVTETKPPKPYGFIRIDLESSANQGAVIVIAASAIISIIVRTSAYLFAVGIFLNMFSSHISFLVVQTLIEYLEQILDNSRHIYRVVYHYIESPNPDHAILAEIHRALTPYIRSQESIWFDLLIRIVNYLENINHPDYDRVDELFEGLRESGNDLMEIYRDLEDALNITIDNSPIRFQDTEDY